MKTDYRRLAGWLSSRCGRRLKISPRANNRQPNRGITPRPSGFPRYPLPGGSVARYLKPANEFIKRSSHSNLVNQLGPWSPSPQQNDPPILDLSHRFTRRATHPRARLVARARQSRHRCRRGRPARRRHELEPRGRHARPGSPEEYALQAAGRFCLIAERVPAHSSASRPSKKKNA